MHLPRGSFQWSGAGFRYHSSEYLSVCTGAFVIRPFTGAACGLHHKEPAWARTKQITASSGEVSATIGAKLTVTGQRLRTVSVKRFKEVRIAPYTLFPHCIPAQGHIQSCSKFCMLLLQYHDLRTCPLFASVK